MSPDGLCRYLSNNAACDRHSNYVLYESTAFSPRSAFSVTSIIASKHAGRAMTTAETTRRPGFDAWPVHEIFVVHKVALWQGFSYYPVPPVSIALLMFYTHLHLQSTLLRRTGSRKTGNFEINQCCSDIGENCTARGLLTGDWRGSWKGGGDSEYREFESTLHILIFKK